MRKGRIHFGRGATARRAPGATSFTWIVGATARAAVGRAAVLMGMTVVGGCQFAPAPPLPPVTTTAAWAEARPAATSRPMTRPAELTEARQLFYEAAEGDARLLDRSAQLLDSLGGPRSSDPEVVAYSGAVELLRAAYATWPWEKARLANDGLALEDRAVSAVPGNLEIRFLRGVTEYKLPRFVGRWPLACADLAFVARDAEAAARAGRLDPRAAATDLDYHGRVREQEYDAPGAIAAWRAAIRVSPNSPGGADALKHLREHRAEP